ncbi:MAG: nonstructural protein [Microviridae sp.]|nr:MAG: nonstructural protein [Microviridae sp.]
MILRCYSVKDTAVDAFMPPFFERHDGAASRAFANAVKDPNHAFSKSPGDFLLYFIGLFDDSLGSISSPVSIQLIIRGAEIAKSGL